MDPIRLLQHENFVNVLIHDLVVVRLSMQLRKVGEEVKLKVAAWIKQR